MDVYVDGGKQAKVSQQGAFETKGSDGSKKKDGERNENRMNRRQQDTITRPSGGGRVCDRVGPGQCDVDVSLVSGRVMEVVAVVVSGGLAGLVESVVWVLGF